MSISEDDHNTVSPLMKIIEMDDGFAMVMLFIIPEAPHTCGLSSFVIHWYTSTK